MEIARVSVGGVSATAQLMHKIPCGLTGASVTLEYTDEIWAGLIKNVYFVGVKDVAILNAGDTVYLPTEVISFPNVNVKIGICGIDGDQNIAIPTLWADLGTVQPAAPLNLGAPPQLPIWAQLMAMIGNLQELDTEAKNNLVAAINEVKRFAEGNDIDIDLSAYVKSVNGIYPDPVTGDVGIDIPEPTPPYNLPIAGTELGGVKNGGNVVVNEDGTMTAPESGDGVTSWNDLTDKPFYEEGEYSQLIDNKTISLSETQNPAGITCYQGMFSDYTILEDGAEYTVTINGVQFVRKAVVYAIAISASDSADYVIIGNAGLLMPSFPDTGENWMIGYLAANSVVGNSNMTVFLTTEQADSVTISLAKGETIIHTLDEKFIPDTIARASDAAIPDMAQNDETAKDYIKNRTHWEEFEAEKLLFENKGMVLVKSNTKNYYWGQTTEANGPGVFAEPGDQVKLLLNNKEYQGVAYADGDKVYVGNLSITDSTAENTGEDYLVRYTASGNMYFYTNTSTAYGSAVTISLYLLNVVTYHQLDEKFIPDTIARTTDIPTGADSLPMPANAAAVGQFISVSAVDESGKVTATEAVTVSGQNVEPMEDDIPKVFFGDVLPQTKDDTIMSFRYISKTKDISGYCKTKAQGNSSMSYPKKNQTVKLYKDAECTEKLMVDFKGWGPQNKFCFKANWVDLTHARNVVSARLWGDVVKSRANYAELPELLRTSPNQGAVDGFPVKVYADGIYQGRYTLNIPKDAWMANMNDELENHCILCGENYVSGCFRAEANIDGSDWTDEVHDTVPDSIKNRWNEAIRFVMNSTDEEFVAGIGSYFDVPSLIDYYLFGLVTLNNDGFGKNQLYMTYDGLKWYATVYDLDNTFGTYLGSMLSNEFPREKYEDYYASYETRYGNLLYIRLADLFIDAIKARYLELKNGALSVENIINRFERFTDIAPPYLVAEDYAETTANGAFTEIPLKEQSNIQQIRDFILNRYPYVDGYIESLGTDPTLLYSLPSETTFTGVSGQKIDTGVKLFDEPKSFTIIAEISNPAESPKSSRILSADYEGSAEDNWKYAGGINIKIYPYGDDDGVVVCGSPENGALEVFRMSSTERMKMAVVYENGAPRNTYFKKASEETVTVQSPITTYGGVVHDKTAVIGTNQDGGDLYSGTIYALKIHNYAMTTEEATAKLMA